MAIPTRILSRAALLSSGLAAVAHAQTSPAPAPQGELSQVTVTAPSTLPTVAGWGDKPLWQLPLQANVYGASILTDLGARRLADLVTVDPSMGDAYNSIGYYDNISVRGYTLDNRFNFLRDGLPINAETAIPLDNKSGIEILKGTSGIQVGTSSPGGLINFGVKRPIDAPLRRIGIEARAAGTVSAAADLNQRFGTDQALGARLNVAAEHLDPTLHAAQGERHMAALALDWRLGPGSLLEAEVETSHRSQPSQPGFSMLGNTLPSPGDPNINLNQQPWSLPVVFDADTASLRWTQALGADWRFVAHGATQRLRTDDRVAFPFGCTASDGTYYADRYCPDGTYDLYDFRSNNEHRRLDALDLSLQGQIDTGAVRQTLQAGVLQTRVRNRFENQAYNFAGTGNVEGTLFTPPSPAATGTNTNRDEHSTELYVRDAVALGERTTLWAGLRHSRIHRQSANTDGTNPLDAQQSFTTPWMALSYAPTPEQRVYASAGQGVQSDQASNLPIFTNPGQAWALKSRQVEVGWKGSIGNVEWNVAAFDIHQPSSTDFTVTCTAAQALVLPPGTPCMTHGPDGTERHRGIDADASWRTRLVTLSAGTEWLQARRADSQEPGVNGTTPPNVPAWTLKFQSDWNLPEPGAVWQFGGTYEGRRFVLPDDSVEIGGFTSFTAALRYVTRYESSTLTWRLGVDNLFDRRAWRESPYQYSHVYLYPLAPRTVRVGLQVDL